MINQLAMNTADYALVRRHQRGVSLVEVMVAMVIGLFLVAVMSSIYLGAKNTFAAQETVSRLHEGARYAVDAMSKDLRMSGFRSCVGSKNSVAMVRNNLNSPTNTSNNFTQSISISRYSGGGWSPILDSSVSALSPSTASDVVTVYRPVSNSWSLIADLDDKTSPLTISATSSILQNDILLVGDCTAATVFQATNATPGVSGSIEHVAGAGSPGNATNNLGQYYLQDANVYRMQAATYYIAPSVLVSGSSALWVRKFPAYDGPATMELVPGAERLAVTLGVDSNGDFVPDQFIAPNAVTASHVVMSARIELLLASTNSAVTTTPQPYTFAGTTTTPTDFRMRTVVSVVTSLRNNLP